MCDAKLSVSPLPVKMIKLILISVILLSLCSSLQSLYIAEAELVIIGRILCVTFIKQNFPYRFPVAVDMECVQKTNKVLCQFDFTNVAQQDYYLMKRHTPLEGLYSPFLTVKQGDQLIQYQGYVAYRLPATKDNYVLIQAGSTVYSPMIELTRAYKLPRDGVYTVEYTGQLSVIPGDTMSLLQDTELTWNHIMNNEGRVKASSHISVADSHNLQILEVDEQREYTMTNINETPKAHKMTSCKTPTFKGKPSSSQMQVVTERHEQLCEYLPCVIGQLDSDVSSVNARVQKWFGKANSAKTQLKEYLSTIQDNLLLHATEYTFGSPVCDDNPDWAAAAPSLGIGSPIREASICPPYFQQPPLCNGVAEITKEMIILHEATHMYEGTVDDAYPVDGCLKLAEKRDAFRNANNFAYYYCEAINHQQMDNPKTDKKNDCAILK